LSASTGVLSAREGRQTGAEPFPLGGGHVRLDRLAQLCVSLLGRVGLEDAGVGAHHLRERPEPEPLPVRQGPTLPPADEVRPLIGDIGHLLDQPALADAGLARDRDQLDAGLGHGALEHHPQLRKLVLPSDER
jgi:hypothetical protein